MKFKSIISGLYDPLRSISANDHGGIKYLKIRKQAKREFFLQNVKKVKSFFYR